MYGSINCKGKWTLHIFKEDLYTEVNLNILSDILIKMWQSRNKNIKLQMDNDKVYW